MATINRIDGPSAFHEAKRKARYGHNDWLCWRDADGPHAARKSPDAIKAMLLAVGTGGKWTLICADGTPMRGFWWLGLNLLRQSRRGW